MNLKEMVDKILYSGSSWTRKEGFLLFEKNLVCNIKSKRIQNIYHIYGNVHNEKGNIKYNCHIKVDMLNEKILGCKCSCMEFEENSKASNSYKCKHIMAVAYGFFHSAKQQINRKQKKSQNQGSSILTLFEENKDKRLLKLDVRLKYMIKENLNYYEAEFRVGKIKTHLINSLNEFISSIRSNIAMTLSQDFTYEPRKDYFSEKDEDIIEFIKCYVDINKVARGKEFQIENGKVLKILPNSLRSFLKCIDEDKEIQLNYDYLEYKSKVYREAVPVSFTIKSEESSFILRTKKKFPIPLNEDKDVYLYDRKIFLPPREQLQYYNELYSELKKNGQIKIAKSTENLKLLIVTLRKISDDIMLDEETRKKLSDLISPSFYFDKIDDDLICNVNLSYIDESIDILSESRRNILQRDIKLENKIHMELERLRFIKKDSSFIFIGNDEEIFDLLLHGLKELKKLGSIELSDKFNDIRLIHSRDISVGITDKFNKYLVNFDIDGIDNNEYNEVFLAYSRGDRFYKNNEGRFINFTNPRIRGFFDMIKGFNERNNIDEEEIYIDKSMSMYLLDNLNKNNILITRGKEKVEEISNKLSNRKSNSYLVPEGLNAKLRDYQIQGYSWIKSLNEIGLGGVLADEMGLGKTIQTIAFLLSERNKKSLIITPTSLIYNWKDEFSKFAPSLKIGIVHGTKEDRIKVLEKLKSYDVILTTYGTLKNDFHIYENHIFDYCIIDEAQNIKNPDSQNAKLIKQINAKFRLALSGTPIENNLLELWSIFDFIMPGFLYSKEKFKKKFINSADNELEELKTLINPFILRRVKEDVLSELPSKIEKKYYVEMTSSQKKLYKSYMKDIKDKVIIESKDKITILSYLTKLRQLCLDPSLIMENYTGGNGKVKVSLDIVKNAMKFNRKILIFSQFTSVLKKLSEELEKEDIKFLYLDGGTSAKERIRLVNEFNAFKDINVFLISLKAGGTGLNLTSASMVLHFDPWWNPAIEDQATDRAHRIGQKNAVEVIKLISKDTIEEKIIALQEQKSDLVRNIISGDVLDGNIINKLSDKEILELFY